MAGQPARDEGDPGEHEGGRHEGQPVVGGDAKQEALEEPCRAGGRDEADERPGRDEPRPLPDDEGKNVSAMQSSA